MAGRTDSADRSLGQEMGRALAILVVIAAAVAGWFAFERIALADDDADLVSVADDAPPAMPTDLMTPGAPWDSFHLTVEHAGSVTSQVWFHEPTSSFTHVYVDRRGDLREAHAVAEDFARLAAGTGGGGAWDLATTNTAPMRLAEVMPEDTNPFVTLVSDTPIDGARRLVVHVDGAGFSTARPTDASAWARDLGVERADAMSWTLDVRPDGYIERWEGRAAGRIETWSDWAEPPASAGQ